MALRYDGTLPGFLCLLKEALRSDTTPQVLRGGQPTSGELFATETAIVTDDNAARRVVERLQARLGREGLFHLGRAFLSEEPDVERELIAFVRAGLRHGPAVCARRADPEVHRTLVLSQRTSHELHRLLGLVRFVRLPDDLYLARLAPRAHVVPLLARHFAGRLPDQNWLIVDVPRRVGVWGKQGTWELVESVDLPPDLPEHTEEGRIASLWRGFYHSIAIPERINPALRQQFLPKRTWAYLTEMMAEGTR